ncbi:MAG: prepilin-type N-terminal cleavage/methylation domain-containing protein [Opitutaceae bacterium]|jgi:prepilin-type N-terminal cleavage/methylation domain-containing protein
MCKSQNTFFRAFTLIELLVVISIIAVMAGGVGLLLKDNNPGSALRSSQATLLGILASARGQAALNQTDAMVIVQADTAGDNYLRSIRVVVETSSGSNTWKEVGGEVILPVGVYVVPSLSNLTGCTLDDTAKLSTFFETTTGVVSGVNVNTTSGLKTNLQFLRSRKLSSLGSMSNSTGGSILIAAGQLLSASAVKIDNTAAVRGVVVSKYGVPSMVGESDSFDKLK